jgi:hypothetical protein
MDFIVSIKKTAVIMETELNVNFVASYFHCLLFSTRRAVGGNVQACILTGFISRHGDCGQC